QSTWPQGTGSHLACHAVMRHSHPADQSTTDVVVRTADHAEVTTVAHFKTGNRSRKLRATVHSWAVIRYCVRAALAGYRVRVNVTVRRGSRSGTCSTWFTPRPDCRVRRASCSLPDYVRLANAVSCATVTDCFAVAQDELGDLAVALARARPRRRRTRL